MFLLALLPTLASLLTVNNRSTDRLQGPQVQVVFIHVLNLLIMQASGNLTLTNLARRRKMVSGLLPALGA